MLWNLIYMWYSIVERRIKNNNKNEVVSNFFEVYQFEVFICIFITKKLKKKELVEEGKVVNFEALEFY